MQRIYKVVLRGPSTARFLPEVKWLVTGLKGPTSPVDILFRTEYRSDGYDALIHRDLLVEATGSASSLELAIEALSAVGQTIANVLAFCTNASISDLQVHLAYDCSIGVNERAYFQTFKPGEYGLPRMSRIIDCDVATTTFKALGTHSENARITRAIGQYFMALSNWQPGREIMSLAHLYMGVEAITKAVLREEKKRNGLHSDDDLANYLGIEKKKLDPVIRERFIFQGDKLCYDRAKEASDAFEHGFKPLQDVRVLASETRDDTARYLREAIAGLLGLDEDVKHVILQPPYNEPMETQAFEKCIKGKLLGDGPKLNDDQFEYPLIEWDSTIRSIKDDGKNGYDIEMEEHFNAQLASGIAFQHDSIEIRGPRVNKSPD